MELKRARTMLNYVSLALALGVAGAVAKLVYSFFPWANVMDAVIFALLGHLAGLMRPDRRWTMAAAVALPALAAVTWILAGIGAEEVARGTGGAWVLSAVIIPVAALTGAAIRPPWARKPDQD